MPFKVNLIGSSDAHRGLAAVAEEDLFGKTSPEETRPERIAQPFVDNSKTTVAILAWEVVASGHAAAWADDGICKSIWDAMPRRETDATRTPRMLVRFSRRWDSLKADAMTHNPAVVGERRGVPMGACAAPPPKAGAPPSRPQP